MTSGGRPRHWVSRFIPEYRYEPLTGPEDLVTRRSAGSVFQRVNIDLPPLKAVYHDVALSGGRRRPRAEI